MSGGNDMSKARMRKWNAVMKEIEALYLIENTMSVGEFRRRIKPLRDRQDALRDK